MKAHSRATLTHLEHHGTMIPIDLSVLPRGFINSAPLDEKKNILGELGRCDVRAGWPITASCRSKQTNDDETLV